MIIFRAVKKIYPFKITFFFLILFLYANLQVFAKLDSSLLAYLSSFEEDKLENHPILSIWYGYSNFDDNLIKKNIGKENKFTPLFNVGIDYGFKRYKQDKKYENLYLINGENAFLENISSHLKSKQVKFEGYTIDGWRFGFSMNNGFGLNLSDKNNIEFTSKSSFVWYRFDFENYPEELNSLSSVAILDTKYKFGSEFTAEISSNLSNFLYFTISEQNSLIYRNFDFTKWFPSFVGESILQKLSDPFDNYFFEKIGKSYFIYKFIYKTAISFLVYEIRKEQSFAPFSSEKSVNFWSINVKLAFTNSK
jgi:hypothetical protein